MFKIENGGTRFYQWDTNRRIIVESPDIPQVHFCNTTDDCSLVVDVYTENGVRVVNVPNILLQDTWPIRVYGYESYTKHYVVFNIVARTKPADYVYTETEIQTWGKLEAKLSKEVALIEKEFDNYYTREEIERAGYQTAKEVAAAIESSLDTIGIAERGEY